MNKEHTFHDRLTGGIPLRKEQNPVVTIRAMSLNDYDAVLRLWKQGDIPYRPQGRDSKKNIAQQLKQPTSYFLVAEAEKQIIGAVVGTHDGRKGWINRLVVAPPFRKKGIGRRLVEAVEQHFTSIGIDIVASLIEDWNITSMQVFTQLGYTKHPDILYYSKRKSPKT
jgi:ribosomal protein S18 acetylase RimI-like enzyme